ncbi:MAG TPA: amino acid permease [Planctomycetaceae bacterium]|nr:amino acid permease [Planctomycetaceae bacterium]
MPTDVAGSGGADEGSPGLLRALGLGSATAIVVGGVIGSGIFTGPSKIAAEVGSFPLIISAWAAGGVLCLLGALCIAELAAMLPRAGGIYVYLREAYGGATASSFAVSEYLFGRPASIGALAVFFVTLVTDALKSVRVMHGDLSIPMSVAAAIALIALVAWINMMGVVWGGRLQSGATLIKAGFLGGLAVLPFVLAASGVEHALTISNYTSTISAAQPTFAAKIAAAMLPILWAYNGWHDVAPVAEEIRHPERNIPLALLLGVLALIGLYCGANLAYHGVLSMQQIANPQAVAAKNTAQQMLATLLSPLGPDVASWGAAAMSATMLCGVFGTLTVNVLLGPRIAFAMGRDDFCFRQLGMVHSRWRTPVVSILVQCSMSAVLVVLAAVAAQYRQNLDIFNLLTDCVVVVASPFFMLSALAVCVLRYKHPEWARPYRVWGYPVVPALFLAAYAWLMWHIVQAKPFEACVSVGMVLPGVPLYYAWQIWGRQRPSALAAPAAREPME